MANRDIAGLLTGIPSGGIDPLGSMSAKERIQQRALRSQQRMGSALGGMFSGGQPTGQQQLIEAMGEKKRQERLAQDTRRETLIETAKGLKLDLTVNLLQNNGSMSEALEQIRKAQESDVLKTQGRRGKVAIANNRNVGAPMLKAIGQGDYDSLSNEEFMKVLSGEKATLKVYTDSSGQAKPFRVNESGRVYNKDTEKWVMPSE